MDEIQKVLVEAGRKDLAQLYYKKVAAVPLTPKQERAQEKYREKPESKRKMKEYQKKYRKTHPQ